MDTPGAGTGVIVGTGSGCWVAVTTTTMGVGVGAWVGSTVGLGVASGGPARSAAIANIESPGELAS